METLLLIVISNFSRSALRPRHLNVFSAMGSIKELARTKNQGDPISQQQVHLIMILIKGLLNLNLIIQRKLEPFNMWTIYSTPREAHFVR